jgi:hypothetical protein
MFVNLVEIFTEQVVKTYPLDIDNYGRPQLMYGPASRVNQSGIFFHFSTLAAYFGLSGLTMDKS